MLICTGHTLPITPSVQKHTAFYHPLFEHNVPNTQLTLFSTTQCTGAYCIPWSWSSMGATCPVYWSPRQLPVSPTLHKKALEEAKLAKNIKTQILIVQLGPKLQSSAQVLARSRTLYLLCYPPTTHHPPKTFQRVPGILRGWDLVCWLNAQI